VHVGQCTGICKGGFDGIGQIDANDFARAEFRGEINVSAFAAAGIEDKFALEIGWLYRGDPREEFLAIGFGEGGIMGPFIAEGSGGRPLRQSIPSARRNRQMDCGTAVYALR